MTAFIPDGILADMRMLIDDAQPDTATNSRTSVSFSCYVEPETKLYTIEHGLRFKSNRITSDYQQDVKPGDLLMIGTVTYAVQETSTPRSQPVALDLVAIPTALLLASVLAPETATFQHETDLAKKAAASVYVIDRLEDVRVFNDMPAYPWTVVYENTVQYQNGDAIGTGDRLLLASLFGTDGSTTRAGIISKPRPILHGLPFMAVYVKEL